VVKIRKIHEKTLDFVCSERIGLPTNQRINESTNQRINILLMCLAIPGKVTEIRDENGLKMGSVDINGTVVRACLEYVPDIVPGQYTIVHAGFALKIIDEEEAMESLSAWEELLRKTGENDGEVH
jgi:hydrogenase expression/formation protein HypC